MLFFRKPTPQKTFDYKQFIMINKEFKKDFKTIFNILDYFNNSILKSHHLNYQHCWLILKITFTN